MPRYLVLTMRLSEFDPSRIPDHYAFLDRLRQQNRIELAGPFTDHSGGAYLLDAGDMAEATALAYEDPLHTNGSSRIIVHEWQAH
ncbi:MAG: YciI family protein [Rhodanobacteraceae bacterium]